MFGIGMSELILVLVLILVVFGPRRLPEITRNIGKVLREIRGEAQGLEDIVDPQSPEETRKEVKKKISHKKKD